MELKKIFTLIFIYITNISIGQNVHEFIPALLNKFPNVRDLTISNDGNEAYFTVQSKLEEVSQIVRINKVEGQWTKAKLVAFSSRFKEMEPSLSPNNLRLYYVSNRPLKDSINISKDYDIWYVERKHLDSSWSNPINIGAPINTMHNEFYPSLAYNNNLYFTSNAPGFEAKDNILMSTWKNNQYTKPQSLGDAINSNGYEYNAYISPDENYIIFGAYKRTDGYGSGDLYISIRDKRGRWMKAINLGDEINSKYMDYCPFVDGQTKTLYFTSKRSLVKSKKFVTVTELIKEINQTQNGASKLYKVEWSLP